MPQLTASLEHAERMATLPKTDQNNPPVPARISAEKEHIGASSGKRSIALQFVVDSGDYIGRELPGYGQWTYIPAEGDYLAKLFETINALKSEWTCSNCSTTSTDNFLKEKVKGAYHFLCPHCSRRADVKLDGSWVGKECRLRLGIEKMDGSDNERNTIAAVLPRD